MTWISYWQRNILSDQGKMIEQAKFTSSALGIALEKQIKAVSNQRIKSWNLKSLKTSQTKTNN